MPAAMFTPASGNAAQLRSLEQRLRQDNAIVQGLIIGGDAVKKAEEFVAKTLNVSGASVVDAYWLGRLADDGRPRKCPLLIRFRSVREKRSVQDRCRVVRPPGVFVDNDVTAEERAERAVTRAEKKAEKTAAPPPIGPSTSTTIPVRPAQHQHGQSVVPVPAAPSPTRSSTSSSAGAAAPEARLTLPPKPKQRVVNLKTAESPPMPAAKRPRLATRRQQPIAKAPGRGKKKVTGLRAYFAPAHGDMPDNFRSGGDGSAATAALSPTSPRPSPSPASARPPSPPAPARSPWTPPPRVRVAEVEEDPPPGAGLSEAKLETFFRAMDEVSASISATLALLS